MTGGVHFTGFSDGEKKESFDMNPAILAISAVPWREVLRAAPLLVESARKLYESAKSRGRQKTETTSETLTLELVSEGIEILRDALDDVRQSATDQAELTSQLAAQVEAISRGLEDTNSRQSLLTWLCAGAILLAIIAIVVAFVL